MKYYKPIERTDECCMWCREQSTTNARDYMFWEYAVGESADVYTGHMIKLVRNIFDVESYPLEIRR